MIPWQSVDWLVLNEAEARSLADAFGEPKHRDSLDALAQFLPDATALIMTKGADGVEGLISVEHASFQRLASPAGKPMKAITDTTGAGDTFTVSSTLRSYSSRYNLSHAVRATLLQCSCKSRSGFPH